MSTQTTNYNMTKIELTDSPPDITVLNDNFDTIDMEMKELSVGLGNAASQSSLNDLSNKVGTTTDTGASNSTGTVMGKLNKIISGNCVIKSVQNGIFSGTSANENDEITINTVDPEKSFVILDWTDNDSTRHGGVVLVSLTDTILTLRHKGSSVTSGTGGWQVVEFY